MLLVYRRRDAREMLKGDRFELLRWAEFFLPRADRGESGPTPPR